MPIDKAELATELDKNPEIQTAAVEALQKKGYSIYDKAKHDEFISNIRKDVLEKDFKTEAAKIHDQYDKDIESLYGVKREQNEKTYDYNKRAATAKIKEFNDKILVLETSVKEKGDPTGVLTKKIETLEQQAKIEIEKRETRIKELEGSTEKANKSSAMANVYAEVSKSFLKQLPPMFERTAKIVRDELMQTAIVKDGIMYVGDGTGAIKKNPSTFKEITMEEQLKEEFKDVIDAQRKQGGTGSGNGQGKGGDSTIDPLTVTKENFVVPADVKTQNDLMDAMLKMGLVRGTPAFNDIWSKFALGTETALEAGKKVVKQVGKALPMGN